MLSKSLVVTTDRDGLITNINAHCERVTGWSAISLRGAPFAERLCAEASGESARVALTRLMAGETVDEVRGEWRSRGGERIAMHWGYSAYTDAAGRVLGAVITGADSSTISSMQLELAETLDRYQAILDTAVDAIITMGVRGEVLSFNRAAERIFGYRADEVIGRNVSMLMPQPYRDEHDDYIRRYRDTRRKRVIGIGREVEGLRKDGSVVPLDLAVGEVRSGTQELFTGIIRDITDRREAERELRHRLDELAHVTRLHSMGELASGLAHEINQPLTAIVSSANACVRLIDGNKADNELLRDALDRIARQGERAAQIMQRLRRFVEKREFDKVRSDLAENVAEAVELMEHELRVQGVHLRVDVQGGLEAVEIDRIQIQQVIVNLLRNAIEAMHDVTPEKRELQLRLLAQDRARPGVAVFVDDSGPGFGNARPEQLFEPFLTTKANGMGQGLTICRRIVEAHGGSIWAEASGALGGATFCFWLPTVAADSGD